MKRFLFILSCMAVLGFAGIAQAEEPAILADLGQNFVVEKAHQKVLEEAQGAAITEYRVAFNGGPSYVNDPQSRFFRNWYTVSGPSIVQTNYTGTWYVSQGLSQIIWNQSTSPLSQWCTSY